MMEHIFPETEHRPQEPIAIDEILQSDLLFVELARTLVQQNYFNTVFQRGKGSFREMREDRDLTPILLFVNVAGIEEILYDAPGSFREIDVTGLGALLVREADHDGFVDEFGQFQDPSDGGYYIHRKNGKFELSREKHIFTRFDDALIAHNQRNPDQVIEKYEDILPIYLPEDFSSFTSRAFKIGGRTQGALAAALGGNENTKSYIVKQTVYDGVTGKLARFGNGGVEMEFFLYRLDPGDERAEEIESYHPSQDVMGVLRVYDDKDNRQIYQVGPSQLGLTVPELAYKVSESLTDVLDSIGKKG